MTRSAADKRNEGKKKHNLQNLITQTNTVANNINTVVTTINSVINIINTTVSLISIIRGKGKKGPSETVQKSKD